jgi:hypothetical protein
VRCASLCTPATKSYINHIEMNEGEFPFKPSATIENNPSEEENTEKYV